MPTHCLRVFELFEGLTLKGFRLKFGVLFDLVLWVTLYQIYQSLRQSLRKKREIYKLHFVRLDFCNKRQA